MIVVDLGCCLHDGEGSIERLIVRHEPRLFYGFDPLLPGDDAYAVNGTTVVLSTKAAWTEHGTGKLGVGGRTLLDATVIRDKNDHGEWAKTKTVEFFDFGAWLQDLPEDPIVKMNIEGAEFPLLENLCDRALDNKISLLYVAWHDDRLGPAYTERRETLQERLRCPEERWYMW